MKLYTVVCVFLMIAGIILAADLDRGRQLYQEGKYAEAAAELAQVVRDQDDSAEAHRLLGLALIEQGKASEAAPHIRRANEIDPSGDNKIALARLYVEQKDYDKAEAALADASGEDLRYVRGLINLNRQKFQEAADDFEADLESHPHRAYAHYYAGLAYNGLKRPDKMLTHFEMFLKMKPDAPEARKVRAVMKTGR